MTLAERKAENVAQLIARFERVYAADPCAPISQYCFRRLPALYVALLRHRPDTDPVPIG